MFPILFIQCCLGTGLLSAAARDEPPPVRVYTIPRGASVAAVSPDGRSAVCADGVGEILLLDLDTGKYGPVLFRFDGAGAYRYTLDGKALVALGTDTVVRPLDGSPPTFSLTVPYSTRSPNFKPDGTLDLEKPLGELIGPGTATPVLSPDIKVVFAHDARSNINAWNLSTGKRVQRFRGNGSSVDGLSVSDDGKVLFAVTGDELLMFSVATGEAVARVAQPKATLRGFILPEGKAAFCYGRASDDPDDYQMVFRHLDIRTGRLKAARVAPKPLRWVRTAVLTADGKHVLIPNGEHPILHVISTETGKEVTTFRLPIMPASLVFTPDGQELLIGDTRQNLIKIATRSVLEGEALNYPELPSLQKE